MILGPSGRVVASQPAKLLDSVIVHNGTLLQSVLLHATASAHGRRKCLLPIKLPPNECKTERHKRVPVLNLHSCKCGMQMDTAAAAANKRSLLFGGAWCMNQSTQL
jgi:hypothetical protein